MTTRCLSCESESLRVLGVQPGRLVKWGSRPAISRNPLSVKLQCKDCGHVWYHEVDHIDLTLGEWADGMETFVEQVQPA